MKDRVNQLFKDKFILVMLVLSLIAIVAAAGTVRIRKGNREMEESPYLEIRESDGIIAQDETAGLLPEESRDGNESIREAAAGESAEDFYEESAKEAGNAERVTAESAETDAGAREAGAVADSSHILDFTEAEKMLWPVRGNVILGYSMDQTTYFPTLEQYKCNPANVIQSEVSTPVFAPADAKVLEIGNNEEIGNFVRLDLGNSYTAVCGQLKEIPVVENEYLHRGDVLGYIAEPTKYYTIEGINLYFELQKDGKPVDALDYLE